MARLRKKKSKHAHKIAVIDDDLDLLEALETLLKQEGHQVRVEASPEKGIAMLQEWKPHLLLLDYFMVGMNGADVVRSIRTFNQEVEILLVTGYAEEQPGRKLLEELEIQGYHDKSNGSEQLLILLESALKHYRTNQRLLQQQHYLRKIIHASSDISKLQPPEELLKKALFHLADLVQSNNGLIATENSGILVLSDATVGISIRAGMGKYQAQATTAMLPKELATIVEQGLQQDHPSYHPNGFLLVPLRTRNNAKGCMVLELAQQPVDFVESCKIFAGQVMQSLENVLLYEMATIDTLTRTCNRGHGMQRLRAILKLASRRQQPTSIAMVDLDHFKQVNDNYSHAAGDILLRHTASLLLDACRESDLVIRYGGEEFCVVLCDANVEHSKLVAERIRTMIEQSSIPFEQHTLRITASIGLATAPPGYLDFEQIIHKADLALYQAKEQGRNRTILFQQEAISNPS